VKKRYYKITPFGDSAGCWVTEKQLGSVLQSWLEGMEIEDGLRVKVVEMTEKKFKAMPEYEP